MCAGCVPPCRYTSGDVRLWDTLHWDSSASYLKTSSSLGASWESRPAVTHVQVNSTVAAAAFHHGEGSRDGPVLKQMNLWTTVA